MLADQRPGARQPGLGTDGDRAFHHPEPRHGITELLRLADIVRRLAFDTSLPPTEAMGRIRDTFQDYDQQGGIM